MINSLCAQINNVLCCFKSMNIIIKMTLLMSYCSSHYGAELWVLGNKSINDICITWLKGLRRAWGIPIDTHSDLLAPMCNSIPIFDELCRRNCNFINSCLISDSFLVMNIAVYGVYFGRMSSPLGRNAQFCCDLFNSSLYNFSQLLSNIIISKVLASLTDDRKSTAGRLLGKTVPVVMQLKYDLLALIARIVSDGGREKLDGGLPYKWRQICTSSLVIICTLENQNVAKTLGTESHLICLR